MGFGTKLISDVTLDIGGVSPLVTVASLRFVGLTHSQMTR